jgi:death-on-curing protein
LRDENLLDSTLALPFQTFDEKELYPSVLGKISRITYGLVRNHAFIDGNKRIGTYVMLILLELNNISVDFSDDDIVRIGTELAKGTMDTEQLIEFIAQRISPAS